MNARPLLWLALAQLAIGAAGVFARLGLAATGPLMVGALRLTIAGSIIAALAARRHAYVRHDAATERRLALAGVLLAVHFTAWFAALQHASVAVATLLVCSTPLFTEAWAVVRTRAWRPLPLASIGLAIGGVAIVAGVPSRTETPLGIALALCGAIAMSAYLLLVRSSDTRYGTLAVVGRTYPIAAFVLVLAALMVHDPVPTVGAVSAWSGILALAFISQLFGHTALNAAVRSLSVTFVATTNLIEPIIAAVAAAFAFGEHPAPLTAAGAVLILVAIWLALTEENKPLSGKP